jgi:hypothetical protein
MTPLQITTNETLNNLAEALNAQGFQIIAPAKPSTYFHYFKDGKMCYVQVSYFGGFDFSMCCKPRRDTGSGVGIMEMAEGSTENAIKAHNAIYPRWAYTQPPTHWETAEQYVNNGLNKILGSYIVNYPKTV